MPDAYIQIPGLAIAGLFFSLAVAVLGWLLYEGHRNRRAMIARLADMRIDAGIPERVSEDIVNLPDIFKRKFTLPDMDAICLSGGVAGLFWMVIWQFSAAAIWGGGLLSGVSIGVYMTHRFFVERKLRLISSQFPEALDLMVRGAKVGLSIEETIHHIQTDLQAPLSGIFKEISDNLGIGISLEESLERIAGKMPLREFRYMAAILTIQRKTGGQYAAILEKLSQNIRDHHEQSKRLKSLTAEGRMAANVVAVLTIGSALAMFFLNPDQFNFLINDPSGQDILLYSALSVGTGLLFIYRLLGMLND